MYNLDSLSLKYLIEENGEFLKGAVVQKIQMPSKREILLSLRNLGENKKLYINVDPKFAHMNFITDKKNYSIKIPKEPPMFCMLLRKHMEGAKFQAVRAVEYERIVEFYFEVYDEIGSAVPMCLCVEFMGKHSNAILYNASNKIIAGCVHNISPEKSSVREVWGGIPYVYPPKQQKTDILRTSISGFFDCTGEDNKKLSEEISDCYYYFSRGFLNFILQKGFKSKENLFTFLQNTAGGNSLPVKEFWLQNILNEGIICDDTGALQHCGKVLGTGVEALSLNFLIEKYFSYFVLKNAVDIKKGHLKKLVLKEYKRYKGTVLNADKKTSFELNRKKGELLLTYMHTLENADKKVILDGVEIALDVSKTVSENAQHYFALYQKGKTADEIQKARKNEAEENLKYLDEINFSIENAKTPDTLDEIEEELDEFLYHQAGRCFEGNTKVKGKGLPRAAKKEKGTKIQVESIEFMGFEIFIGKNNKQNDYLIKKVSSPEDIWLHGKDCPSSHVIIKTENGKKQVPDEVLLYACKLVKENSQMKNSAKASIIFTKRKFIKRPPDTHLGYVTYREEKEIVV